MNGLVGRRRREHQALPGPRGCGAWGGKVLCSLQKRGRAATSTVTPAWRAYRNPQAAQRQGPTAPARALTFTHRVGTTHRTQGSRDSETQRLAQNHQPGSREAAQTSWRPGTRKLMGRDPETHRLRPSRGVSGATCAPGEGRQPTVTAAVTHPTTIHAWDLLPQTPHPRVVQLGSRRLVCGRGCDHCPALPCLGPWTSPLSPGHHRGSFSARRSPTSKHAWSPSCVLPSPAPPPPPWGLPQAAGGAPRPPSASSQRPAGLTFSLFIFVFSTF
ncbi:uncharacterized protein LOC132507231 [Lagenorhynchus albirostris]|uniref:uncharacterized protein LOC132507231 n=1 Tax=Lagenorhynchus albirostris TaxID=27610 RepID=UPI0028EA2D28|nr:uncharacterized protein LOC132507231 [Lagenorhynchus albirostris]